MTTKTLATNELATETKEAKLPLSPTRNFGAKLQTRNPQQKAQLFS